MMNLLKKVLPKYKTKSDLKEEIKDLKEDIKGLKYTSPLFNPPVYKVYQKHTRTLKAYISNIDSINCPLDYIKEDLCKGFYKELLPFVEWDIINEGNKPIRVLVGTLMVVEKEKEDNDINRK